MKISSRKLNSIIRESIEAVLGNDSKERAKEEIYNVISRCCDDTDRWNDARDNGRGAGDSSEYLLPAVNRLMDIIKEYGLSSEEYDNIVDHIMLPMASKMNFYYYDLQEYLNS